MLYNIAEGEFPPLKSYQKFGAPRAGYPHQGIDLSNGESFRYYPWKSGVVRKRAYNDTAGWSVWVIHNDGTRSMFVHMRKQDYDKLRNNQRVVAGQTLGYAGKSGNATAILLHYEYHPFKAVDPLPYILDVENMENVATIHYKNQIIAVKVKDDETMEVSYFNKIERFWTDWEDLRGRSSTAPTLENRDDVVYMNFQGTGDYQNMYTRIFDGEWSKAYTVKDGK